MASVLAYIYYLGTSFQRLSDYGAVTNVIFMILSFSALFFIAALSLNGKERWPRVSFAPAVGAVVVFVAFMDYFNPMFPYSQGFTSSVLLIGLIYGIVVIGWFGLERVTFSDSRYRAVPLGLLLPVLTLFLFALTSGFDLEGHKIFYRTFDYADIALALGVGIAVGYFREDSIQAGGCLRSHYRPPLLLPIWLTRLRTLLGDRHDSQEYEVDALGWVYDFAGSSTHVRTDERLAYNARALYDFEKDPYLPSRLVSGDLSDLGIMNMLLEEWTVSWRE